MCGEYIVVAVAAIRNREGEVLLTRRADDTHQGGLWEFPGGKLEPGESPLETLHRELKEEIDIKPRQQRPLIRLCHDYGDKRVTLIVYEVTDFSGKPRPMEGQPMKWTSINNLENYPMPSADTSIVTALQLPSRYLITGNDPTSENRFLEKLDDALGRGIKLVQFRAPKLTEEAYLNLAGKVLKQCRDQGAHLMLNSSIELARQINADGIHLNSKQLANTEQIPATGIKWISASCHTAEELKKAVKLGANFAVLSPVLPTKSHPGTSPLGWNRFEALVRKLPIPVYALGGMSQQLVQTAQQNGAQGIAAIGALWDNP